MEIDTGAAVSIISDRTCTNLPYLEKPPLQITQVTLRTYRGESIPVLGKLLVKVTCQGINQTLPILVVKEEGPCKQPYRQELVDKDSTRLEKRFYQLLENGY